MVRRVVAPCYVVVAVDRKTGGFRRVKSQRGKSGESACSRANNKRVEASDGRAETLQDTRYTQCAARTLRVTVPASSGPVPGEADGTEQEALAEVQ